MFNSVNADTGEKYHVSNGDYYKQIRQVSDRLCREHGLSVIEQKDNSKPHSYIEWLRQSKGQPTFRSMLEADLRSAIDAANDLGHFFLLMEHQGYEIKHGNRLGFRLRGQERFMYPGRKDPRFTEDGIRAAIYGNLEMIQAGLAPVIPQRRPYKPYQKHPKYTGFLALYFHYLYVLGKIEKQEYPPRMTTHLKAAIMQFDKYKEQFDFLRENNISTAEDMAAFQSNAEETLAALIKRRTILNVRKKEKRELFNALAAAEALAPVKEFHEQGHPGAEGEYRAYLEAEATLDTCGIPREVLIQEKSKLYNEVAEINREIRHLRKQINLCCEIREYTPKIEQELNAIEAQQNRRHRSRSQGRAG